MVQRSLAHLKRKREELQREGVLPDCWIEYSKPGGTARGNHRYGKLRSRRAFTNGQFSRYLKDEEIPIFQRLIENARALKQIEREISWLETRKRKPREAKTSSASDEWYTPPEYIEMARQVMGAIDCDPASNATAQDWIQAPVWYGIEDNGLEQPWHGRTWLNPPYGNGMQKWTSKAIKSYENGTVSQAVLLVRPAPGSRWYQELAALYPSCVMDKRIRFIDANGQQQSSPVHGNVFFYLGENIEKFRVVFSEIGGSSEAVLGPPDILMAFRSLFMIDALIRTQCRMI